MFWCMWTCCTGAKEGGTGAKQGLGGAKDSWEFRTPVAGTRGHKTRAYPGGFSKSLGFLAFCFCCWGGFVTLWVGGPVGVFEHI